MPSPTLHDVHVDSILSAISIAYGNSEYIADQIFPRVPVAKQSDKYFIFDRSSFLRDQAQPRAPGTRAQRADYAVTTGSYQCLPWALAHPIPDETRKNADAPLKPDITGAQLVTDALLLSQEIRVATLVTTSTNWAYSACPTDTGGWLVNSSEPLTDIDNAVNAVVKAIGRKPNLAVMSWDVWRKLKMHPDLTELVKYTRPGGQVQPGDVGSWFGFDKVLVGAAIKDTAQEGATASISYVWGDGMWIGYVTPTPALMVPSAGYVFEWESRAVSRFREDQEKQDIFEAEHNIDEVITASEAGAYLIDLI